MPDVVVAQWCCQLCDVVTDPVAGIYADREAAMLAVVHDQVHHRGTPTAVSSIVDVVEVSVTDTVTVTDNVVTVPAGAWGPEAAAS